MEGKAGCRGEIGGYGIIGGSRGCYGLQEQELL